MRVCAPFHDGDDDDDDAMTTTTFTKVKQRRTSIRENEMSGDYILSTKMVGTERHRE